MIFYVSFLAPFAVHRRNYLVRLGGATIAAVTGCVSSSSDDTDDGSGNSENGESSVASGTIVDGEIQNPIEEQLTLAEGQTIAVQVEQVASGEEVFFTVGDGTAFVVREHFSENGAGEFPVESDGRHNIRLAPRRHEVPMNQDVTVGVQVTVDGP